MRINFEYLLCLAVGGFGLMFGSDANITKVVLSLIVMIGFDLLTGITKAIYQKDLKSSKWIDGFLRKIMMIICVSFCYYLDNFKIINVGISLESASAMFFITGEVISVLENFIELGVKLPQPLCDYLANHGSNILNTNDPENRAGIILADGNQILDKKTGGEAIGK